MPRCCEGSWYLLPNGIDSWAFVCKGCERVLFIAEGDRDEVLSEWP